MKIITPLLLISFILSGVYSCSNPADTSTTGNTNPGILYVDETGRVIDTAVNDWSDWCFDTVSYTGARNHFYGAYPNPADNETHVRFDLNANDTVSMYFLRTETDTLFLIKNESMNAGAYELTMYKTSLGFSPSYQRLFFRNKNGLQSTSKPCNSFGDILFR